MAVALSALVLAAQRAADMINSPFVDTATWLDWANQAQLQLYGKVFSVYKDSFYKATVASGASPPASFPDIVLVNGVGNNVVALPADFRALRGLTQDPDLASRKSIPKFNFAERDGFRVGTQLGGFSPPSRMKAYRVVARSTLIVEPPENCAGTYRLYYINAPVPFASTTDNMMAELEPWNEYISQAMARKALLKEESDISAVDQRMAEIVADLQTELETDENQVDSVVDVEGDDGRGWRAGGW